MFCFTTTSKFKQTGVPLVRIIVATCWHSCVVFVCALVVVFVHAFVLLLAAIGHGYLHVARGREFFMCESNVR